MKRLRLEHIIAWILLFIFGAIVIHAPLTVYIGSHFPTIAVPIKAWKELLLLVALVLLTIDVTHRHRWVDLMHDRLVQCIAAFTLVHLVTVAIFNLPVNAEVAGLMIDLRYAAYFVAVYVFLRLYPAYKNSFLKVGLIGAVVVAGFAVLQLALPRDFLKYLGYGETTIEPYLTVDKNPAFVRENSTLRGPNPLGAYAVMALAGVISFGMAIGRSSKDAKVKYAHVGLAIAALIALWVSYSRSAWIGALVAVAVLVGMKYHARLKPRVIVIGVALCLILLGGVYMARDTYFVKNVIVHDNPTTGANIDSNTGHAASLAHGISQTIAHPFGLGVGSTGSASAFTDQGTIIENQFLFVAHEVGWIGLAFYIALIYLVLRRLWTRRENWRSAAVFASGIGMIVIGLMLPVWVDDTVSIVWWGMAAVVLANDLVTKGKKRGPTTNKKTA